MPVDTYPREDKIEAFLRRVTLALLRQLLCNLIIVAASLTTLAVVYSAILLVVACTVREVIGFYLHRLWRTFLANLPLIFFPAWIAAITCTCFFLLLAVSCEFIASCLHKILACWRMAAAIFWAVSYLFSLFIVTWWQQIPQIVSEQSNWSVPFIVGYN